MIASPQVIAQRWANGMSGAGEKMRAGIQAVTVSPTSKAAARADAYLAGVQRAVASGKYRAALERVTLEDWRTAAINKGIPRVAAGATEAKGKFQSFMAEFIPFLENGLRQLDTMPRGDLETNINRAVTMMRYNATFKRSGNF
jgi:hypothetical protein